MSYFSFNGNLDSCITIRTALCFPQQPSPGQRRPSPVTSCHPLPSDGRGHLPLPRARGSAQRGGGWVNDSEPEAEFQETVNKSKAMLKAVALAETFAKTPWQPT